LTSLIDGVLDTLTHYRGGVYPYSLASASLPTHVSVAEDLSPTIPTMQNYQTVGGNYSIHRRHQPEKGYK